jgi:hypothetical protein
MSQLEQFLSKRATMDEINAEKNQQSLKFIQ